MHNIGFEADPEIRDPATEDPEAATSRARKNEGKTIFDIFLKFEISLREQKRTILSLTA